MLQYISPAKYESILQDKVHLSLRMLPESQAVSERQQVWANSKNTQKNS